MLFAPVWKLFDNFNREPLIFAGFRHILRVATIWSTSPNLVPYKERAGNRHIKRLMGLTEVNGSGLMNEIDKKPF